MIRINGKDFDFSDQSFCVVLTGDNVPLKIEQLGKRRLKVIKFPENGKNPKQRAGILSSLDGPVIIVTVCPYVISDFDTKHVLVIYDDGVPHFPNFQTFGAGTDLITSKIFNFSTSFGDRASSRLAELKEELRSKSPSHAQGTINTAYRELGDSAERVFLIAEAMDKRKKS